LSGRETDVLRASESSLPTDQIAAHLRCHRRPCATTCPTPFKIGGRNRLDAIRIARDAGWL
jgi:two-component system response regulator DesR